MKRTPAVLDVMTPSWELATEYKAMSSIQRILLLVLSQIFQYITLYKISKGFYWLLLNEKYLVQYTRMFQVFLLSSKRSCVVNFIAIFKHIFKSQHTGILLSLYNHLYESNEKS